MGLRFYQFWVLHKQLQLGWLFPTFTSSSICFWRDSSWYHDSGFQAVSHITLLAIMLSAIFAVEAHVGSYFIHVVVD
jgi:hypothetical protein